ncbi:MAG: tetratricopeptide repeat protein [Polyangiaceae bacterium]
MTSRSLLGFVLAALLLFLPSVARADKVADAEALFNQGKVAREAGDYVTACRKFEDSQRLDPQLGTLINLADCYEQQGRWATAWARYGAALELAEKRRDDRIDFVREGKARVEPKMPKLAVIVTHDAEGLTVEREGVELSPSMYGTPLPVDPGRVTISIKRGGEELETREVEAVEAQEAEIELDLAAIAKAHPPKVVPPPPPPPPSPVPPSEPYDPTHRNVGLIIGAVGAVAVVVAGGLEIGALVKKGQANEPDACVNKICSEAGLAAARSARTFAEAGQWLGIGGLAVLAVGATVFFTAPSEPEAEATAARILPWGGRDGGGLLMEGRF